MHIISYGFRLVFYCYSAHIYFNLQNKHFHFVKINFLMVNNYKEYWHNSNCNNLIIILFCIFKWDEARDGEARRNISVSTYNKIQCNFPTPLDFFLMFNMSSFVKVTEYDTTIIITESVLVFKWMHWYPFYLKIHTTRKVLKLALKEVAFGVSFSCIVWQKESTTIQCNNNNNNNENNNHNDSFCTSLIGHQRRSNKMATDEGSHGSDV